MHFPFAACLALGHARFALVEQIERMIDGVADLAFGRAGDAVAGVERGVDGGFESGSGHYLSLDSAWAVVTGLFRDLETESQGGLLPSPPVGGGGGRVSRGAGGGGGRCLSRP